MPLSVSPLFQAVSSPVAVVDAEAVGELKSDIVLLRPLPCGEDHSPRDILSGIVT